MSTASIATTAVVATIIALAAVVSLVGRAEARHEAREREAMQQAGPPILGGAERPQHLRRRRWT